MKSLGYQALLALLLLMACGEQTESRRPDTGATAENPGQGLQAAAAATNGAASQERQEVQKTMEAQLAEFRDRLKALKAEAQKTAGKAKAELNRAIKGLETKMAAAKRQLEKLRSASAEAWEDAKSRMKTAIDELQQAYDRAVARFKKSA